MQQAEQLRDHLHRIDGRGYKAYKSIIGEYDFGDYILTIDYVQGDPFASPSKFMVRCDSGTTRLPEQYYPSPIRRMAAEDFLLRCFNKAIETHVRGKRGSGKSGVIYSDRPGQQILKRSALVVSEGAVKVRFSLGLPAKGRRVLGLQAEEMIFDELPKIVRDSLRYENLQGDLVTQQVNLVEDQEAIRGQLSARGLVAFIGNGSILPRESGISDQPMGAGVVPFESPPDLMVDFDVPNHGRITGLGIPKGITLIVGGGYHGKSTVLRALERGVYNHIPGDGREWVVTNPNAVKIRAEDGRRVEKVNISPFITHLPRGISTTWFSSEEASGSTSQAANIIEPLELGAECLLVDEDTSATNFMIRDVRMQHLVAKEDEPITPFVDKIQQLYNEHNVSTVLVLGGSGDYFDVADTIIRMKEYRPIVVTRQAKEIANQFSTGRQPEGGHRFGAVPARHPDGRAVDARRGRNVKIRARGLHQIEFGRDTIDVSYLEQLVEQGQTSAIGDILYYASHDKHYLDGNRSLRESLELVLRDIDQHGLQVISPFTGHPGYYALPRIFEIGGAINRYRRLVVVDRKVG